MATTSEATKAATTSAVAEVDVPMAETGLPAKLIPRQIPFTFPKEDVDRMTLLMKTERLPADESIPGADWDLGVDLNWLQTQKTRFEDEFNWLEVEKEINRWNHYTVEIEGIDIHFVHHPSKNANSIPLLLLHGWPGSFYDFHKIIEPLSDPADDTPSFHVVVPSLPGYALSSYPPRTGFTIVDIARVVNTLMVTALGYKRYVGHGGDWGSYILRIIGSTYHTACPLAHFTMFRAPPAGAVSSIATSFLPGFLKRMLAKVGKATMYSDAEKKMLEKSEAFQRTGRGYVELQSTKPTTIGYAIGSSPLALLTYIGEKFYVWSDPMHFSIPDLFATVAIYYLTQSFASSVLIYHQSKDIRGELITSRTAWRIRSKIGFSAFPFEIGASPRAYIRPVGDLVFWKENRFGGHFPALENPDALAQDLRDFVGRNWKKT